MLGVTLPCPHFAAAWLEPPTTIEYRCTTSIDGAIRLREALPRERVGYIIDMQVARDRYASAYRFRGTPTPAVALAQLLAGVTVVDEPRSKSNASRFAADRLQKDGRSDRDAWRYCCASFRARLTQSQGAA